MLIEELTADVVGLQIALESDVARQARFVERLDRSEVSTLVGDLLED